MDKKTLKSNILDLNSIFLFILCIALNLTPLFRGSFFTKAILVNHIAFFSMYLLYLAYKYVNKQFFRLNNLMDISMLFMIIAHILPIIFGQWANLRDAWGEVLKYVNLFVVYLMVKDYSENERFKKIILSSLVFSGVLVALIGLFSAMGYLNLQEAITSSYRIASTFQYPNTLAAYLGTIFIVSLGLCNSEDVKFKNLPIGLAGYIIMLTFVLTYSRIAWILLPIFLLGQLILIHNSQRRTSIIILMSVFISVGIVLKPFSESLVSEARFSALLILFLGMILFTGLFLVLEYVAAKIKGLSVKAIRMFVSLLLAAAIALVVVAINVTQPLVFDNTEVSTDRLNQVTRSITTINANKSYQLKAQINTEATSAVEGHWPWRIRVFGLNSSDESTLLYEAVGSDVGLIELEMEFDTLDDTDSLNIVFTNRYPDTKVVFHNATLYDQTGNILETLKLSYRFIPESLVSRFSSISLSERSSVARLIFYNDALKIFKDYPIVGAGGGSWKNLYEQYQSKSYISKTTHSYLMSIITDTGLIGISIFLIILSLVLQKLYLGKKDKDNSSVTIGVSILFLLAHSIFDFNFSFLCIMLLYGVLLGCLKIQVNTKFLHVKKGIPGVLMVILVMPTLLLSISLYVGYQYGLKALASIKDGDGQAAYEYFVKANRKDPFNYSYLLDQASILWQSASAQNDEQQLLLSEKNLLKALVVAPKNLEVYQSLIDYYINTGDYETAISHAQHTPTLAPFKTRGYELKFNANVASATEYLKNGELDKSKELYKEALSVVDELAENNLRIKNPVIFNDEMLLALNKVYYILNQMEALEAINLRHLIYATYFNIDADKNGIPDGWKLSRPEDSKLEVAIEEGNGITFVNEEQSEGLLYSNNFSLTPNTKYGITVEFTEGSNIEEARISLHSRNGTTVQLAPVAPKQIIDTFEFVTTGDIEPGGQLIRIQHLGKSNKSFTIKSITIFEAN